MPAEYDESQTCEPVTHILPIIMYTVREEGFLGRAEHVVAHVGAEG